MAVQPFIRLWPLHPLSGDTKNIEYTGGDAKPGFEISIEVSREIVRRRGRKYTPFGREIIADTYVNKRKFYCPLPSDLEVTRAWNPEAPPDDPSWLQVSAELVAAGHEKTHLVRLTAAELLKFVSKVVQDR